MGLNARYKPNEFYVLEPHAHWAKEGQVPIDEIGKRVYGDENFSALERAQAETESTSNDSYILYELNLEGLYESSLEDFDQTESKYSSQSLRCVLADLIRRGEIPRGDYLLHHWW